MLEYIATILLTSPEALTEDNFFDLAELGGSAEGRVGGHTATVSYVANGVDLADAVADALRTANKALPHATVEAFELTTLAEQDRRLAAPAFPSLVGVAEVADLLGVSRQRASALQTRDGFPAPVAVLRSGPVWRADDLSTFAKAWSRQPGRPRARRTPSGPA
jgi:hypothetical protein